MGTRRYYPFSTALITETVGSYAGHQGTDFAVAVGTPVRVTADGVITFVGGDGARGQLGNTGIWANGEGMTIDLVDDGGLLHRFGHLSSYKVRNGQRVKAGDLIAYSGNTGWSTGPHLHWELRYDHLWSGGSFTTPQRAGASGTVSGAGQKLAKQEVIEMADYFAQTSSQGIKYAVSAYHGKKRAVPTAVWNPFRRSGAVIPLVTLTRAELDKIPNG